ncbi:MAG: hypothetical protein EB059_11240, partial [Alphaproteobacteria bacterium]|nr:hypothetical protein [Alphaproteobacteria bacterium]
MPRLKLLAFGIGDQTMIADYGKLVCLFHMQHAISSAQCVALFFQVLAARYAARVDEELCDALRAVL